MNDGFISAVENAFNPDNVLVRARKIEHLENIFPERADEIYTVPNSDYAVRIDILKAEFAKVVTNRILNINYNNFKNSVVDGELHDMYLNVWHLGYQMQKRQKKGK